MVKHLNSDNSKTAQQLFLILCETIQFNAIYMMEVVTKDGNFLVKTDFEARGAILTQLNYLKYPHSVPNSLWGSPGVRDWICVV